MPNMGNTQTAATELRVFDTVAAEWLRELMNSYVSLAQDCNCVDDALLSRAGMAIELADDAITACGKIGLAYASDGNTKAQKAAHAAVRSVVDRSI